MSTRIEPSSAQSARRRVLVLVNMRSGLRWSFDVVRRAFDRHWERPGTELTYQFCQSVQDGVEKSNRAVSAGVDTIVVVGGDGTVNSVGRALIGKDVSLGIVPVGSGNGFARHFEIPLAPEKAVESLARATVKAVDVGLVNDVPFLVTCSMAWDASIARGFAASPIRGLLPYVFAGVQEFFEYKAQDIRVVVDGKEEIAFAAPLVFTIANLSQYGGGARIAPHARADDGQLELVVALRQDIAVLLANIGRLFDGSLHELPQVVSRSFETLEVRRERSAAIQVDGELIEAPPTLRVRVIPGTIRVLVP